MNWGSSLWKPRGALFWTSSARVHSDSRRSSSTVADRRRLSPIVADSRRKSPTVAKTRPKNSRNEEKFANALWPTCAKCGCLISLSNESSKVSFSHAHLAHVGHKALANFFFIARIFRSRIGDSRRRAATVGMYTSGRGPKKCTSRLPYKFVTVVDHHGCSQIFIVTVHKAGGWIPPVALHICICLQWQLL